MADSLDNMIKGFRDALEAAPHELIVDVQPELAYEYGRQAAKAALAPIAWAAAVGDFLDTSQATAVLGVSRQALNKRLAAGSLIGLPAQGTTHFPKWQFDMEAGAVRVEVRDITLPFLEELGTVDHFVVAAWAQTEQSDLNGATPSAWVLDGKDRGKLLRAARRAATRLAA
jgi:hypothetical protein